MVHKCLKKRKRKSRIKLYKTKHSGWKIKIKVRQFKNSSKEWKTQSKIMVNLPPCLKHSNFKGKKIKRSKKRKMLYWTLSIEMLVNYKKILKKMKIPKMLSVHTLSKVSVKKEKNAFILMILQWIETKKSICMSIKEPSWLWIKLEQIHWIACLKRKLIS